MTRNKSKANKFYDFYKQNYEDSGWFFNLAEYDADFEEATDGSNMLRELNVIKTTEHNG